MKHIKSILEFARLSDTALSKDKLIKKLIDEPFKEDVRLIFDVYIKKYDKHIFIKWNDHKYHVIVDKIKNRTNFKSISEFNKYIEKAFKSFFDEHFDEIDNIKIPTRYALYLENKNFYIIVDIANYDDLFKEFTQVFISTIAISSPFQVHKIIDINDDYF